MSTRRRQPRSGVALLAVLWLSAALATIALSLADTVRGEAERSATAVDGLRSSYLAEGAARRAALYLDWARKYPLNPAYKPPVPYFNFDFPEGQATVEIIPETAKFNINYIGADDLVRILVNLGVDAGVAQEIAEAIIDWRTTSKPGSTPFDAFYQTLQPPYLASHAQFQDIEELLSVKGITPEIFYGTWQNAPEGSTHYLMPRSGLRDCLSVYGATSRFDANFAAPAVLAAIGVPPEGIDAIVRQRNAQPFRTADDLAQFAQIAGPGFPRLRIGGNTIFTLRSTARVRLGNGQLSDMRRTVAALVKMRPGTDAPYHILRWYETLVE
ncbi:MAG TPA: hypothetical protein VMT86_14225 [Bryobacteraceae bacterium]|nr:hypothetical protein [Bryobacteraceae bacterium]